MDNKGTATQEFFHAGIRDFEGNPDVAKEIGELMGYKAEAPEVSGNKAACAIKPPEVT